MRRTKGFTLVELLVVIAIIALLMGILMPALARVRAIAFRMTCGTNLAGIGKAMLIYANDYDEEFPKAGYPKSELYYTLTDSWYKTKILAFGDPSAGETEATITSSFYSLIKFADVTPKSFICKGDTGVKEFELAEHGSPTDDLGEPLELPDVWDFGYDEGDATDYGADAHCSYAYHHPYCSYPLSSSSEPAMPVAADPNPWFIHAGTGPKVPVSRFPGKLTGDDEGPYGSKSPFWPEEYPDTENIKFGNAYTHQEDGQNVLFADGSVAFEKNSFCGIEEDNIYTIFDGGYMKQGHPRNGDEFMEPWGRKDAYLITNHATPESPFEE